MNQPTPVEKPDDELLAIVDQHIGLWINRDWISTTLMGAFPRAAQISILGQTPAALNGPGDVTVGHEQMCRLWACLGIASSPI